MTCDYFTGGGPCLWKGVLTEAQSRTLLGNSSLPEATPSTQRDSNTEGSWAPRTAGCDVPSRPVSSSLWEVLFSPRKNPSSLQGLWPSPTFYFSDKDMGTRNPKAGDQGIKNLMWFLKTFEESLDLGSNSRIHVCTCCLLG